MITPHRERKDSEQTLALEQAEEDRLKLSSLPNGGQKASSPNKPQRQLSNPKSEEATPLTPSDIGQQSIPLLITYLTFDTSTVIACDYITPIFPAI